MIKHSNPAKKHPRPFLSLLCALGLGALFLLSPSGLLAQHVDHALSLEPTTFETMNGKSVEAEKGTFYVPENRSSDSEKHITLSFIRFKSTNPNPGSPIVYLAGGPGGSGSGTARGSRFDLFMAMREVADVIAFDQRGTGLSGRLHGCPYRWTYPLDKPGDREALLEAAKENAQKCASHWEEQGVDLAAYNTNESADDLEVLRQVLETDKISLWSISYGTHLALATIKRYPTSIDRVIMAGLEGPDHTIKMPSDQQRMLEAIDALVKADPVMSKKMPDFLGTVSSVLDRLEQEPVTVELERDGTMVQLAIGKFDVQRISTFFLRGPSNFKALLSLYQDMAAGDFSSIAPIILENARSGGLRAMSSAMDAASGISDTRWAQVERERKETLLGDAINFPYPSINDALGVPDLGAAFRAPVQTDVPALFISGTLDGRTPVSNAEEIRPGFSTHTHLIIEGAGHSDPLFLSSPRIAEVMLAFMKGEATTDERITLPPVELHAREAISLDEATLARYEGRYHLAPEVVITITKITDALSVNVPGEGTFTFYPETSTSFFMREANVQLGFITDEQDQVAEIIVNQEGTEMRAKRVE